MNIFANWLFKLLLGWTGGFFNRISQSISKNMAGLNDSFSIIWFPLFIAIVAFGIFMDRLTRHKAPSKKKNKRLEKHISKNEQKAPQGFIGHEENASYDYQNDGSADFQSPTVNFEQNDFNQYNYYQDNSYTNIPNQDNSYQDNSYQGNSYQDSSDYAQYQEMQNQDGYKDDYQANYDEDCYYQANQNQPGYNQFDEGIQNDEFEVQQYQANQYADVEQNQLVFNQFQQENQYSAEYTEFELQTNPLNDATRNLSYDESLQKYNDMNNNVVQTQNSKRHIKHGNK